MHTFLIMYSKINIEVSVYSGPSAMNKGIKRAGFNNVAYCYGSVNPRITITNDKRVCSIHAFLCKGYLGMEVITHESVHIATTILRNTKKSIRLSSQIDDNEERLAYTIGRIGKLLVANLTSLGYYD